MKRLPLVVATPYEFGFQNPRKTVTFSEARMAGQDPYQVLLHRPWYILNAYWEYLLIAGFSFVFFLATIALVFWEQRRWGLILLMLSPHLYSIGAHMLTYLEPRFLLPSMFCLFIGPAYTIRRLVGFRKGSPLLPQRFFSIPNT